MSCNGCRVLRKGCSESCILRPCLQWIDSADAQGHATVFVAKFFGRAGLMGFINAVPETQRRALFQSLLYEACGRTVNPVFGAVGLLWAGNWQVCQAAVETVLKGGSLKAPSPCSLTFSSLPQGPLHPTSNPGKDNTNIIISAAASRGRDSLTLPTITTVVKEDNTRVATTTEPANNPFQGIHGYESKDHAVMVKSSWDLKWDAPLQQGGTVKGNVVNANVVSWPDTVGNKKVGEKREGTHPTQVLARRVKPSSSSCGGMGDREYGMCGGQGVTLFRKDGHRGLFEDQDTVVGSTEHLDLGLTLMVKDGGKGGQITGLKRVYSPSCDSVNSEGSVTSLDTTPRHGHGHGHGHHGHASFSSSSQVNFGAAGDMAGHMMNNNRKLLPLLL